MGPVTAQPDASSEPRRVFTLGHSNWPFPQFVQLLNGTGIDFMLDVRNRPASVRNPQFTQPAFEAMVREEGPAAATDISPHFTRGAQPRASVPSKLRLPREDVIYFDYTSPTAGTENVRLSIFDCAD